MNRLSLGNAILLGLEKAVDGYVRIEDLAYNPHKYLWGYDRVLKKNTLSQTLKRLREKGLIEKWVLIIESDAIGQKLF